MKPSFSNVLRGSRILASRLTGFPSRRAGVSRSVAPATAVQEKALSTAVLRPGMGRSKKRNRTEAGLAPAAAVGADAMAKQAKAMSSTTLQNMTHVRFDSLPLSTETKRALSEVLGYETCTNVQAASLPVCLSGVDVVCKAKTGTGKTLAFLIPAIEMLRQRPPASGQITILIMSPTRELAYQIAAEAEQLARFHKLTVQSVVGGTNANADMKRLSSRVPDILVGTPGRMIDLLQNSGLKRQLEGLRTLIFDEADRLLDMGFKPDIDRILAMLPPKTTRQTVLFSATYPADIQKLCHTALRPGHELVDTVGETDIQTAEKVSQTVLVSTMQDQLANLVHIILKHQREDSSYKVMVFFTTARLTGMYAELFDKMGMPVLELHSRKSQPQRTRVAEEFRSRDRVVLFTSDVSARGVDYPDVSLVVQMGLPADRDQYIHRVGRTARAGKQGQAVLLLSDFERAFVPRLKGLPVTHTDALSPEEVSAYQHQISNAVSRLEEQTVAQAYQTWLGFYKGFMKMCGWTPAELVQVANKFATDVLGCEQPPGINKMTVGKMGLKGVPGLKLVADQRQHNHNRNTNNNNSNQQAGPPGFAATPRQGRGGGAPGQGRGGGVPQQQQQRQQNSGNRGRGAASGRGARGRGGASTAGENNHSRRTYEEVQW